MKTIQLYDGARTAPFEFDPTKLETDKAALLTRAKAAAEVLTGQPLEGVALEAFEANVERWMAKGFEGHFSLGKALETQPATPRTSLIDVRTVGHEVELSALTLHKKGIDYGDELAATSGHATRLELASGVATPRTTDWPLMKITADGVSEKLPDKGHVEIVFGPVDLGDHAELARRGRATQLFTRAMSEETFFGKDVRRPQTLGEAVARYNKLLSRERDLGAYALVVSDDVRIGALPSGSPSVQTNVELPLRKLGDVKDTTIPALFGAKESEDRAMFLAAREQASLLVDTVLRDSAAAVHGGKYAADSIKLDKLRGTLTLALLYVGKADQHDKSQWPFMPKTGAADVIRSALSVRDKLTLYAHTGEAEPRAIFYDALHASARAVNAARGRDLMSSTDLDAQMRAKIDTLFTPGSRPRRYGPETHGYGTLVDPTEQASGTGSSVGKKLPVGLDYTRKLLTSQVPKIVVELRRADNGVNGGFATLAHHDPRASTTAKPSYGTQATYQRLVAAADHGPERPSKREL